MWHLLSRGFTSTMTWFHVESINCPSTKGTPLHPGGYFSPKKYAPRGAFTEDITVSSAVMAVQCVAKKCIVSREETSSKYFHEIASVRLLVYILYHASGAN